MITKQTIAVTGMMCAGCAANVERRLNSVEGVRSASVNFAAATALVEYDKSIVTPQDMKDALLAIGYDMVIDNAGELTETERRNHRMLVSRVALSWLFAVLTMAVCMGWITVGDSDAANQTMLIMALLDMVYCGRAFYLNAWKQLRHLSFSMDTLVAMSTGISFLFSVFNTFFGESYWGGRGMEWHTYFDAPVMIITFVLTGRLIEERAKNGTASAIKALMGLSPKTAMVHDTETEESFIEKPIESICPGDIVRVDAGGRIPVDGSVTDYPSFFSSESLSRPSRSFLIDESTITGEAAPVCKAAGEKVYAGTTVKEGMLVLRAEEVGGKTVLANIIRMVQEAQGSKAPVQRIADKIAAVFVPAVLCMAVITFLLWWIIGGNGCMSMAVLSAVSVLVIACPCAMGLATPTALMVGIGKAAQRNILIKDAAALENMRHIDALVIDKTGTLTVYDDGETLAPHAAEAIAMLREQGTEIYLMSGDKEETVSAFARQAGIIHWQSRVLPHDKEQLVRRLQAAPDANKKGRRRNPMVAMAGDGINDTAALAAADISIAMGRGTDIAMDVAQVTLMGSDLRRIPEAVGLSRKTVRAIHQNLFWAFVYNIVCIPLAAGLPYVFGFSWHITPMWASALMAFSSVSVVLNSLRLKLVL